MGAAPAHLLVAYVHVDITGRDVVLAVPFSVIGAVWLMWALDYNVSIAVWVGMIALMDLDAEAGASRLLSLDLAYDERWHTEVRHAASQIPEVASEEGLGSRPLGLSARAGPPRGSAEGRRSFSGGGEGGGLLPGAAGAPGRRRG